MSSFSGAQSAAGPAALPTTDEEITSAKPDRHAWGVLTLLAFVYVLNFLDRQLLSAWMNAVTLPIACW